MNHDPIALISAWRVKVQVTAPPLELHVGKLATIKLNGVAGMSVLNWYVTSTRFNAKPFADSGSASGTGLPPLVVPPVHPESVHVWHFEVAAAPLPVLPKFTEQTWTFTPPGAFSAPVISW
jgi:hypothetical protein